MQLSVRRWPYPFRFAFGITDDPDQSTLEGVCAVYSYCESLGIYPTRGTWVSRPRRRCGILHQGLPDDGVTLEDEGYRRWCVEYLNRGGEIALHGVTSGDSTREEVAMGLDAYRNALGSYPNAVFFHKHNAENMYWGDSFSGSRLSKLLVRILVPTKREIYSGHDPDSQYYCGDLMREHIRYTRLFRTVALDVLSKSPSMPFHLSDKPLVRFWFCASAQDLALCNKVRDSSLDRVARRDGLVLMYAHMVEKLLDETGEVRPEVRRAFECIASRRDCWKAGALAILDRCYAIKNLVITRGRTGFVLSNPTSLMLEDVQIESDAETLYLSTGESLERKPEGVFVLPRIGARSVISVFDSPALAEINDPKGRSRFEVARMQIEEIKRLIVFRKMYKINNQTTWPVSELDSEGGV